MKKLFLFMAFLLGMNMTVGAQTASDSYLDMANYATMDDAWDNTLITQITNLYAYTADTQNNKAWVSMSVFGAYMTSSSRISTTNGGRQNWIVLNNQSGDKTRTFAQGWDGDVIGFKGSSTYFGTKDPASFGPWSYSSATSRHTITFYVTNVDQVKFKLYPGSYIVYNNRTNPSIMTIHECDESLNEIVQVYNESHKKNGSTPVNYAKTGLDLNKIYKVVCSTINGGFLEIAFRTILNNTKIVTDKTQLDFTSPILTPQTKTVNVKGIDLQGPISATIVDDNENEVTDGIFTVFPSTISNENFPTDGVDVNVTFTPGEEEGSYTGYYLKLSTQYATDVTIPLTGEATNNTAIVANPTSLTITTTVGTPKTETINVKGIELHGDITATITGENGDLFSVTPTISMSDASAEDGVDVEITFDPDETGSAFTGTLTLSTPYAKQNVEIELKGKASSESFPVTITSAGLSTLYLDFPVEIPYDNLDLLGVYYIHEKSGSELRATRLNKNIPANTGVIVQGNSGTYNFIRIKTADDLPRGNSLLSGCLEDTPASEITGGTVYTLGRGKESYINFFKYTGTKPLQANKAYYLLPSGNSAKALTLSFDDAESEVTGINTVGAKAENGAWYSIQGVQLQGKPATKGIYIHNGKAVIVK